MFYNISLSFIPYVIQKNRTYVGALKFHTRLKFGEGFLVVPYSIYGKCGIPNSEDERICEKSQIRITSYLQLNTLEQKPLFPLSEGEEFAIDIWWRKQRCFKVMILDIQKALDFFLLFVNLAQQFTNVIYS